MSKKKIRISWKPSIEVPQMAKQSVRGTITNIYILFAGRLPPGVLEFKVTTQTDMGFAVAMVVDDSIDAKKLTEVVTGTLEHYAFGSILGDYSYQIKSSTVRKV